MSSSYELFQEALKVFPGGVNSPVRAAVKPYPFYVAYGRGPYLFTIDGERLVDYVLAYGPMILGHAHPKVVKAVVEQVEKGWLFGTPTEAELRLAKKILSYYPHHKAIRFVSTGTEAAMLAIRLARAVTGRKNIIKFDGCYHGSYDALMIKAGSAALQYAIPSSEGVPLDAIRYTSVLPYNDLSALDNELRKTEAAAVILEPIAANAGLIVPDKEFLRGVRELTQKHGVLLIFDEVVTGFRVDLGGVQRLAGVQADITILGKVIGGGFPIGAVLASDEIMKRITPSGGVFNAGTFNAHPVSMAAGLATINVMEEEDAINKASKVADKVADGLDDQLSKSNIDYTINRFKSMFQVFFTKRRVKNADDARSSNVTIYFKFHEIMRKKGVFIPPSQFETCFTSSAHTEEVLNETLIKIEEAIRELRAS